METIRERRLRLWKARQTAEGHDVSGVKTLEEAEHFFDKKAQTPSQSRLAPCQLSQGENQEIATPPVAAHNDEVNKGTVHNDSENPEVPEIPDEEETTDEQCDIDPVDEPV